MANTYSQMTIQCVFAVKGRENVITKDFREELHKYMAGILKGDNIFPLAVGGWKDHMHILFELPTSRTVADIIQNLKSVSSKWINERRLVGGKFNWQNGYGCFSYTRDQRDYLIKYIQSQEQHHKIKTFEEEYLELLQEFKIEYNPQYLFEFYK
ncbi:MAG TPA: IS200/IS605 family transposase [Saprospiraceae bacterium]|jgi:REP element-mobilizing transposase RayT|nr:MAG: transposase [Candidatus Parvibacillus calidus]MCC7148920.1 IS200/IS605 family transposase [Saprospiraceae bacterium]HRN35243.1 IS200/IS605 family transposase [Saprospiraceae bacterium]HRP85690.1 IS200/IS605 family transposase [Saprospiraceae bacterium]